MAETATFGAHWERAALQVNPFNYHGKNAPSGKFADEAAYNSALLKKCKEENISLIAITDHWCVDSAAKLIEEGASQDIVALPGFEANSAEGVHLLVIFEPGTKFAVINAAIGSCGATPGAANGTTGDSYKNILETMTQQGALVVPAHTNVPNSGMLTGRTGVPLVNMVQHQDLHAIAISPQQAPAKDQAAVLQGTAPFNRSQALATIHADDVCHPDTLTSPGATTWFKVSSLTLDSLKLALRTPQTRISLTDPTNSPRALLRGISWVGGFLDNVSVPLAEDLTTFIGGRGTGKSTILESLRYALQLPPLGPDATRDHTSIVNNVLRAGTTIQVTVDAISPKHSRYTITRTVPNPPVVLDASDTATTLKPADIIGTVEVFGQHELAELAQDKSSIALMLERFTGHGANDQEPIEIQSSLETNRDQLSKAENNRNKLLNELADLPRLETQVRHYEETDLASRLEDQRLLKQDEVAFAEISSRINGMSEFVASSRLEESIQALSADLSGEKESPQQPLIEQAVESLRSLHSSVDSALNSIESATEKARTRLAAIRTSWSSVADPQREAHAAVLRELIKDGHNPEGYLAATEALTKLRAKQLRLPTIEAQRDELLVERQQLLAKLASAEATGSKRFADSIRFANEATNGVVNVRPIPSPDRASIQQVVTQRTKGQRGSIMSAIAADDFSPRQFVTAARAGDAELIRSYHLTATQARAVIDAGEPLLRRLEEMTVERAADVYLDVSAVDGKREYRRLEDLSKGQRATALLMLLLGVSSTPLIIDQPEDDLDNRFVYDSIVPKLRSLKGSRQIIVSTHNANVPVLGDAELIIALEGNGQNGWPQSNGIGSLDSAAIRKLAEQLLEGGREAFNARKHLYGF